MHRGVLILPGLIAFTSLPQLLQKQQVLQIARVHRNRFLGMVHSRNRISHGIVCVGAEEEPLSISVLHRHLVQQPQCLLILSIVDKMNDRGILLTAGISLITVVIPLLIAVLLSGCTVSAAALLIGCAVPNRVICRVDFVHFLRSRGISRIHIRVILLCKFSICSFDFVLGGVSRHAQNFIRVSHVAELPSP